MEPLSDTAPGISRDESSRIKEFLKKNSRGMNIREISDALKINRNSVAKYLDILTSREEVEVKNFGKSKVYFLAQRVPISTLMRFTSHLMLIVNRDLQVVQINDAFLQYLDKPRESVIGVKFPALNCDLFMDEHVMDWCAQSLQGTDITEEINISHDSQRLYFKVVLTPTQFPDNTPGIIIFFENITEKKQIKSALAESEENFRTLVDESGDGCVIVDETGSVSVWNKSIEQISGIPAEEIIGNNIMDVICRLLIPEHRSEKHIERMKNAMSSAMQKKSFPLRHMPDEMQILSIDGQRKFIHNLTLPIRIGKKLHYGVIIRDITKRKRAEEALMRERTLLAGLLDSIPDMVFFKDNQGVYLGCNPEFARFTGRARPDIIGLTDFDLYPKDIAESFRHHDARMLETGKTRYNKEWLTYPDGHRILVDTQKSPLVGTDGQQIGILGIARDITEKNAAEELIRQSEEKYRRIVETANEGICVMDKRYNITFVNERLTELLGYSAKEMIGQPITSAMHPDELADHELRIKTRKRGEKETYERCLIKKDGTICWVMISVTPIIDPDRSFAGSFAMLTDITERKHSEQILQESEEKFRHLIDYVPGLAVQGYYLDGTTFYWNNASERLYGYTADEAIGRNLLDLIIPPEMQDGVREAIAGMAKTCKPIPSADISLMRKDGGRVDVFSGHAIVQIPGKLPQLFCMDIDLTERKLAEQKIRESEARFEQVANTSDEWIWEVDAEGIYQYCSAAVERILGYTPGEIVGKMHYYDFFDPKIRDELTRTAQAAFRKHETFVKFINPALHKNGALVILETTGTPVFDTGGNFTGYRGCDTDVTVRQDMETARKEALEQIERNIEQMAILGEHIRNPLTAILAQTDQMPEATAKLVTSQIWEIDQIIDQIDSGGIESERVRSYLRKYHNFTLPGKTAPVQKKSQSRKTSGKKAAK